MEQMTARHISGNLKLLDHLELAADQKHRVLVVMYLPLLTDQAYFLLFINLMMLIFLNFFE